MADSYTPSASPPTMTRYSTIQALLLIVLVFLQTSLKADSIPEIVAKAKPAMDENGQVIGVATLQSAEVRTSTLQFQRRKYLRHRYNPQANSYPGQRHRRPRPTQQTMPSFFLKVD
jgi:hypothetical protein